MDAAVRPLMSHSTLCVIIAIKLDQIGLRGAMIAMSLLNMVNVYWPIRTDYCHRRTAAATAIAGSRGGATDVIEFE